MQPNKVNKTRPVFSVIVPVYNAESYVAECIDSVLQQTSNFLEIGELILVDDGSTDASGAICMRYRDEHPDAITFLQVENGGCSRARNLALDLARGEFIVFLDADDYLSKNAMEEFLMVRADSPGIQASFMRIQVTNEKTGDMKPHSQDYRFSKGTRIANLDEEPEAVQIRVANTVISASLIGRHRFDEDMSNGEDFVFLMPLLESAKQVALLADCAYYYRKAQSGETLTSQKSKRTRMAHDYDIIHRALVQDMQDGEGNLPGFVQFALCYELIWRFWEKPTDDVSESELAHYRALLEDALKHIDDRHIFAQKGAQPYLKNYLLRCKHGESLLTEQATWEKGTATLDDTVVCKLGARGLLALRHVSQRGGNMVMEGFYNFDFEANGLTPLLASTDGEEFALETRPFPHQKILSFDSQVIRPGIAFHVEAPLQGGKRYFFAIKNPRGEAVKAKPTMGVWSKFANQKAIRNHTYWVCGNHIVRYRDFRFWVLDYSKASHLKIEAALLRDMLREGKTRYAFLRLARHFIRLASSKKIWIVSDRVFKGGDNGENFFKHAMSRLESRDKRIYFVFDKNENPTDYARIKGMGKVVSPLSWRYLALFLAADKVISSHFDQSVANPFMEDSHFVRDLYDFDYIYLNHGVMPGDLSKTLNKFNKNMRLVVTASPKEYRGILEGDYLYTEREVKLTGMPRHDALGLCEPKPVIVFLPTWRSTLAGRVNTAIRDREYSEAFKESDYCGFYNALINDSRLLQALERTGYKAEFYVHPAIRHQAGDFHGNNLITVGTGLADYERILNEASLMITDYSSVAFDFAYQRKPIVYCQFDSDAMEEVHFYKRSYFDYADDGFGPITRTLDETVEAIVGYLDSGCANTPEYIARADAFFAFYDRESSRRVYDEIMGIDETKELKE